MLCFTSISSLVVHFNKHYLHARSYLTICYRHSKKNGVIAITFAISTTLEAETHMESYRKEEVFLNRIRVLK